MRRVGVFLSGACWVALMCAGTLAEPVQVVLLGGQSNMAGRGEFQKLDAESVRRIDAVKDRVRVSSQGRPVLPLSYYKADKRQTGFGPELFMGVTLAEKYPDREFLFVKTAQGGTSLYGAWSPDWTAEKGLASEQGAARQKMQLYRDHVKSIRENIQLLKTENKSYELVGMAWMQGEKDSRKELSATTYEPNLRRLIEAYRAEFQCPDLPFVIGQINCPLRGKKDYKLGPQSVRQAMKNVAASIPHTAMVPTSTDPAWLDFPKHDDDLHYNTEGQKRLGTIMGTELIDLF